MGLQSTKGNLTLYIHIVYWRHIHVQGLQFPSVSQQAASAPFSVRPRAVFCVVTVIWLYLQGRGRTWVQPVSAQCSRSLLVWKGHAPWLSLQLSLALFNPINKQWASGECGSQYTQSQTAEYLCPAGAIWTREELKYFWRKAKDLKCSLLVGSFNGWWKKHSSTSCAILQWIFGVAEKESPQFGPHFADLFQSLLSAKSPTGPKFAFQWKDLYKLSFFF